MLTQKRLQFFFTLDMRNGKLVRNFKCGRAPAGTSSSYTDKDGYLCVAIEGKLYRAHRLVWLYVHGKFPKGDIDHINRIKDDNRIKNLRDVTRSENKQNMGPMLRNKCGIKGVQLRPGGAWIATICVQGKRRHLGSYKTSSEASAAYNAAAKILHKYNPAAMQ